jgi:hypothetical protein
MSKIIDELGYRMKIPEEEFLAITLVDNGIDPYKKIKKRSLQHKVTNEYKRRLIINIEGLVKRSSKNRQLVYKKLKLRGKTHKKTAVKDHLHKMHWKKLDKLYKHILQDGRTKKQYSPKTRKTRRRKESRK